MSIAVNYYRLKVDSLSRRLKSRLKTFGALTLRPAAVVCRSVGICVRFVMTRHAAELGLAGTVGF